MECVEPVIRPLDGNPELKKAYEAWCQARLDFNRDLGIPGSDARRRKWQKNYLRGEFSGWHDAPESHQTRLKAKPFKAQARKYTPSYFRLHQESFDKNVVDPGDPCRPC
jgi:Family of unknown function (DUF6065)